MKKRILNLAGIAIMATAIVWSLIQLDIPTVKAAGCPPTASIDNCSGFLVEATAIGVEGHIAWFCTYRVTCSSGGGGDPFEIEQTIQVLD